jgi:hypothetical protein
VSIDKYLYDIIEEYKEVSSEEEKSEIFKDFCSLLWKSKNKRRVFTRAIKYKVRSNLLESDVGQVFNSWSEIDYTSYKSMTKDTDWCSLIRQKINNLYTRYCDKEVILKKDYMDLLKTSKKMYYRWINGEEMNADVLTDLIDDSINKAIELKSVYQKQKMDISWSEYKKVVEGFLKNIFDRCKLADDYEAEQLSNEQINLTNKYIYDFYNEDKSYIKYICDSLEGEMLNYQKNYYDLKRGRNKQYKRCIECGALIEKTNNRVKYCKDCKYKKQLEWSNNYKHKIRG